MIGYHFTCDTLRDGSPIPAIGEWLTHDGPIEPCESGLHASEHPFDALTYAPGPMLHQVELEGDLQSHGDPVDKWVGRRRRIIATIDASDTLRLFAHHCALDVIELWDCPPIVKECLLSRDKSIRAAAWAAQAAAWAAAGAAGAARAAGAAQAAQAARDARDAGAARAARDARAAWDARTSWAARAAQAAAWAARAAGAAALQQQRDRFMEMVNEAFDELNGRTT